MKIPYSRSLIVYMCALLIPFCDYSVATAQPNLDSALPSPRLYLLSPPGGKVGTSLEMTVTGADLEAPESLRFTHAGIKAELLETTAAPAPVEGKRNKAAAPLQANKFKVTIAADVPIGSYDARVVNKWGVSNPRTFVVGELNEVMEKEPNNDVTEAQRVEMNTTINGSMSGPTDVDYYVVAAKKGQRVIFSCLSTTIDSRFHAGLEVYDAKGRLLAANRNYREDDALTDITVPADGDYQVRLFSFTHTQGNTEHFYRLSISTGPWIDAISPCVVEPGKAITLTLYGRNLPGGKPDPASVVDGRTLESVTVTVNVPNDAASLLNLPTTDYFKPSGFALDGFEYRTKNGSLSSNGFFLTYARAPLVLDNEKPRTAETPQEIPVPCEIAGRVERRRDRDWYAFNAKKGEVYNIEVQSDHLGSAALMYFVLRNAATKQDIFESADSQDTLSPKFFAFSSDPAPYRFTVPADGKYLLLVASRLADATSGPRHYYRVRITPDQPDFRLVAVPYSHSRQDALTLHRGGESALTVFAYRRDGFNGDIQLSVEGLPYGVTCVPQTLGGALKETQLVFSAEDDAPAWTGEIKIKGIALVNGQKVEHQARAGGVVWQLPQPQNISPTISRMERSLVLAVREDEAPYSVAVTIDKPILIQGEKANLKFRPARHWPDLKGQIALVGVVPGMQATAIPQGLTLQPVNFAADKSESITQSITVGTNVPPGVYNIVFRTQTILPNYARDGKDAKTPKMQNVNIIQPTMPVSITVLPKTVAVVSVSNSNSQVKIGDKVDVVVKVSRQANYVGEFKVNVVLPMAVKGISVADVIIPAGKDDATLTFKVDKDAMPGNRADLLVRATATLHDVAIVQEVKLALNVIK